MASPFVGRMWGWVVVGMAVVDVAHAAASCAPSAPARLLERFVPADCERCWQGDATTPDAKAALVIDWITPASNDAPLASAALSEALARAGKTPSGATFVKASALRRKGAPQLRIVDGPAWNGYIGLRLQVTRRAAVPPGAVAYVALVEQVPAGSEGSAIERHLVRAVAGPMGLAELATEPKIEHLRAVRVPPSSRADRLASVAWVETRRGEVIAAVASPPPECR